MTTIIVNERTKAGKTFLEFVKNLPFVEIKPEKTRYNRATEKAIEEVRSEKTSAISLEDFRKQLY